jgi:hypothetical protein
MLDDRHFVSDLYVRTNGSKDGQFTAGIQRCVR